MTQENVTAEHEIDSLAKEWLAVLRELAQEVGAEQITDDEFYADPRDARLEAESDDEVVKELREEIREAREQLGMIRAARSAPSDAKAPSKGTRVPAQDASEVKKSPEQTCKFCGGFLTLFKCSNWSLDLFGKESRFKASNTALPGFQLRDLDAKEPVYIDGREASRAELLEFFESCLKHKQPCKLYGKEFRASDETTFCQECGELLEREAISNPCPDCLKNEPDTLLKRFDQSDKDALKTELGYPLDNKEYTVIEDAELWVGSEWQGYRLELWGVIVGRYSETWIPDEHLEWMEKVGALKRLEDNRVTLEAWGLFPFTCIPHLEDSDLIVRLCRMRVFYKGSPLYSEMRAHPYGVRRVAIHGLEYAHVKKDLERAVRGLDLLRKVDKKIRGRKPGAKKYNAQRFRKVSVAKYRELLGEFSKDGRLPTIDDLAFAMGIDRSTFIRYESDYNFSIGQVRNEAISPQ